MSNRSEIARSYDPHAVEPTVRAAWDESDAFHADPTRAGDRYSILIPPPNVTASLHLGHALNNTLQDVLIRYHRARGANALWMPGTDHAGIATQTVVDKRLQEQGEPALKDYKQMERDGGNGRERFIEKVQAWKDEYEADITAQLKMMGCSCDWARQRFTMDEVCAKAVREAFFQLFKEGLIYRGKRLVNWDPATQTALADDEVEMEEVDGHFWYLKYPVIDDHGTETGEFVTVATTRPETMLGDTAIAVNPNDPPRARFIGKKVRLPIVGRVIPVIADDYVVIPDETSDDPKASFASGFLKVTPAHDPNDWEIGQRHNLPIVNVMAPDGTISNMHGWDDVGEGAEFVLGLDRYEARDAIVTWFRENDLLAEVKPYQHAVGHSYRSHVAIEPYLSDQWYVKVTDDRLAGAALRAMVKEQRQSSDGCVWKSGDTFDSTDSNWEGRVKFYPERYARTFQTWHENLRDWCISRQLWWGHRIPVWSKRVTLTEENWVDELLSWGWDDYISGHWERADDESSKVAIQIVRVSDGRIIDPSDDPLMPVVSATEGEYDIYVCALHDIGGTGFEDDGFTRDPDVLDTWFSSALWPLSTMGWPDPDAFSTEIPEGGALLDAFNPTNVLCTAREIITLWVSRMVMFNTFFCDRLPFTDVFIHAMILDGEGRKMSKSLGNGVDPRDIIRTKGADAMRFTLVQMTTQTQDVRMPVEFDEEIGANTSPKFEGGRRLCNKLWNATRFAIGNLSNSDDQPARSASEAAASPHDANDTRPARLIDRWILSRLARTSIEIERALADYQFNAYAQSMYDLFWRDFCDWYLEGVKPTIRNDAEQQSVLRAALGAIHRMFHPIMPFITEALHESIENLDVAPFPALALPTSELAVKARWPEFAPGLIDDEAERTFEQIRELVSAIREVRAGHDVSPKRQITLHPGDRDTADLIAHAPESVRGLAGLELITSDPAPAGSVRFSVGGTEHALSNLTEAVDVGTERERLTKRKGEIEKHIGNLTGRLGNKSYVEKAPRHLVDETRQQLADAETELATLNDALAALSG